MDFRRFICCIKQEMISDLVGRDRLFVYGVREGMNDYGDVVNSNANYASFVQEGIIKKLKKVVDICTQMGYISFRCGGQPAARLTGTAPENKKIKKVVDNGRKM